MTVSRSAWLRTLHDSCSSNNSSKSWKEAGAGIIQLDFFVLPAFDREARTKHLTLGGIRWDNGGYFFLRRVTNCVRSLFVLIWTLFK